ncbi:bifunctional 4-hydroxy-2-oxoglutarate aldolase/2-dehydro-3-deoxy-phosphogluconate aldolase [Maribacter huludaoensis]|uniref:bifunctional 4-hydroxy-2-oxoglutarate aldolase/2-dehydro-3-deoxy-phosphogluconate aldolase n=1 Tax=Maribacter huludaoensis TaxID=3030010 RepID=UPI0023ECE542|nr:bifunctional 4-hydroxy-2-oxoglutarate aldolase/2-dehydro-3-deoxy-phosphogluconate aldolase [Maribacter huludaoensis]MDF4220836.1 bifunctional 4-hydroxy-2-oxoglutarate aldolase/2-dehydro-3-deoxy-phosphogluconate aldolase [Maribacter huludaoensis]
MKKFSEELFAQTPIVGILRGYDKETVLEIARTFVSEGFTNLEITKNSPNVFEIIEALVDEFQGKLNIGCGTVLTKKDTKKALKAGASFIVTPIVNKDVIRFCAKKEIPVFPGAFSPTEIYTAWKLGAKMVKVFPSANLGPSYIKNVAAPLDFIDFMPTGGVSLDNIDEFKKAGAKAFGMGGLLFDSEMIERKDWHSLALHFRKFKEAL